MQNVIGIDVSKGKLDISALFNNKKRYIQKIGTIRCFCGRYTGTFWVRNSVKCKSHISKIGAGRLRKILYMSAINVKNHNPHFKNFVERLHQKGKPPKVIICAIMRKLLLIFFGMLKNSTTFDQNLAFRP